MALRGLPRTGPGAVALAIVVVALCLRLGLVAAQPDFRPFADAEDYDRHAVSLVQTGGYPPSGLVEGGGPSAFRPPASTRSRPAPRTPTRARSASPSTATR